MSICLLCIKALTVGKIQKKLFFLISLNNKPYIPEPLRARIFWLWTQSETLQLKKSFEVKTVDIVRYIRNVIVQFFQKNLSFKFFLHIQAHHHFSTITTVFICYMQVHWKFFRCENIFDGIPVHFVSCIGMLTVWYSKNWYLSCFISILKLFILPI